MEKNYINWFEIPVADMKRAADFYTTVFGIEIHTTDMPEHNQTLGVFAHGADTGVSGALVKGEGYEPSDKGPLMYMNGGEDLSACLAKVEAAGGKVIMPKFKISDQIGHMAVFIDSEGNKLAMHSMN